MSTPESFSLVLGAGGARGMAHLKILETLDLYQLKPVCLAGASIGALMAAAYASGTSSQGIQELVRTHWQNRLPQTDSLFRRIGKILQTFRWVKVNLDGSSALQPEKIIDFLLNHFSIQNFEDLQIPLQVVATDYWSGEAVVFDSGPLKPALMATMAIPGIFPPLQHDQKLLFDGAYANALPVNLVAGRADRCIAVDVPPALNPEPDTSGKQDLTVYSQNMVDRLLAEKTQWQLKTHTPDLYLSCAAENTGLLAFDQIEEVYRHAEPACEKLIAQLQTWGMIQK